MKHVLAYTFTFVGVLTLLLAVLAAIAAAISLSERIRSGPGLMFADVEILAILTLFLCIVGVALLWFGRRLARGTNPDEA
jgi:predicted lysophospholipase L1 biosynthesis ABC-type transport system permease subunit